MAIPLRPDLQVPLGTQLFWQLRYQISTGDFRPGERLPTVRSLAEQLGLAANTVAKAYRELEAAGVVETRGRHGTFVAASADPRQSAADDAARDYVRRVRALGFDADAVARADAPPVFRHQHPAASDRAAAVAFVGGQPQRV